jgi:hypothetical protein
MAPKHVLPRDGSPGFGGPRPAPPQRPAKPLGEAETGIAEFGGAYSDPGTTGHFDARRQFEAAHGTPNPRQLGQRGQTIVPKGKTADAGGGVEVPAPID